MNIKDTLWNLDALGGAAVVDAQYKEAAKEAALLISEVRNLLDLGPLDPLSHVAAAVRDLQMGVMVDAFSPAKVVTSVSHMAIRLDCLGEALDGTDTQESAAPIEDERRIILAALQAAKEVYGPQYFDIKWRAMGQLSKVELSRLYANFTDYRDNYCDGAAKLSVPDFLKEYGLSKAYKVEV